VSTFLVGGPVYCAALMTILGCHELGHFVQARRYGVPASLPFFLPMPLPPIGTMGAVIAMDARVKDRKALFDIGISGPLAGLVPTLACCVVGLQYPFSKIGPAIDTLPVAQRFGHQLGEPLLFTFLGRLTFGPLPEGHDIFIGPLAMAGWVGLLITAINLFPIGQLDGGHVLYALLRDRAHAVATTMLAAAIAGVVFAVWWLEKRSMAGWTVMLVLLTLMGPRHPPTANDDVPLGAGRVVLGWATLAFLIVGFTPNPFPGL
jgi:membrane-associated protease RseP (regulator of RpoE activity)